MTRKNKSKEIKGNRTPKESLALLKVMKMLLEATGMKNKYVMLLLLRMPFDTLFTLIQATFLRRAFQAITQVEEDELVKVCILFGIACCLIFLYNGIVWRAFAAMYIRLSGKLRRIMFQNISELHLSTIEEKSQGDLLTSLNQDAEMALQILGGSLNTPHLVIAFVNIVVSSVLLFKFDLQMILIVWLFLLPHVFINQTFVAKPMTKYQTRAQKAVGETTTILSAMINSADIAILYDAKDFLLQEYEKSSKAIFHEKIKMLMRNTLGSVLIPLFGLGGFLVLLVVGGISIVKGDMKFGDLTAIFQFRGGVMAGTMMVINCMVNIKINLSGAARVKDIIGGERDASGEHSE